MDFKNGSDTNDLHYWKLLRQQHEAKNRQGYSGYNNMGRETNIVGLVGKAGVTLQCILIKIKRDGEVYDIFWNLFLPLESLYLPV